MREPFTVTFGNKKTTINGLPEKQVRYWDNDFTIKFYERGKRLQIKYDSKGNLKLPRNETQLFINGKYFLNFNWIVNEDFKKQVTKIIIYLYCYGCELEEIKRLLKEIFYKKR